MITKKLKTCLLISLGSISLTLGVIGIVLPLLPTTPFLLLAAFCYLRSSPRLYQWLTNHRIFGPYITNYVRYRAVSGKTKLIALVTLWLSLILSISMVDKSILKALLGLIGTLVSLHIISLKTIKPAGV